MKLLIAIALLLAACKDKKEAPPKSADPAKTEPAKTEPTKTDPAKTEPVMTDKPEGVDGRATIACAVRKYVHEDGSFIHIESEAKGNEQHGDAKTTCSWTWNDDMSLRLDYKPEPGMQPQSKVVKLDCPNKALTDPDGKTFKKS